MNLVSKLRGDRVRPRGNDPVPMPQAERLRASLLSENDLFRGLNEAEMEDIACLLPMVAYHSGAVLYEPGMTDERLFLLKQGSVQIYRLTADGRKLVVASVGPGSAFGEMAFLGQTLGGSFAEVTADSAVCVMDRKDIENVLRNHPTVAIQLVGMMAERLRKAEDRLEQMAFAPVPARVARLLLDLADEDEVCGHSHQDLAEMVGTSRETVSRVLEDLKAGGVVSVDRRALQILNREALSVEAGRR
ncbi:MAG: Crp/Fnr family transcriptional regulator [Dehalococcoidia bacterium]